MRRRLREGDMCSRQRVGDERLSSVLGGRRDLAVMCMQPVCWIDGPGSFASFSAAQMRRKRHRSSVPGAVYNNGHGERL